MCISENKGNTNGLANLQISIYDRIAEQLSLTARSEVYVQIVDKAESVRIDFVELAFIGAHIGRSDMWRLQVCSPNLRNH